MTSLLRFGYSPPASGTITPLGVAAAMLHVCFGLGANKPGLCHGGLSSAGIQLSDCRVSGRQFVKNLTY